MDAEQLKQRIIDALEDIKGKHIVSLDVRNLSGITDYLVIATGTSHRQVKALADNVVEELKKEDVRPLGIEGETVADWVLIDYGDVVVHVMMPETRAFYDLERLWSEGDHVAPGL